MKIAYATSWKAACGISTYTSYLIDEVKKNNEVIVLAEDREVSGKDDTQKVEVPYVECWSRHEGFDGMIQEINKFDADIVHCLPKGTEILTNCGLIPIEDINIESDYSTITHKGRLQKITNLYKHDFSGSLVKIKARYLPELLATPEHPLLVVKCSWGRHKGGLSHIEKFFKEGRYYPPELKWIPIKEIEIGDFVVVPKLKEGENVISVRLDEKTIRGMPKHYKIYSNSIISKSRYGTKTRELHVKTTLDFHRLLGYYISEGSLRGNSIRFSFNKNEIEYIDDVKKIMKNSFELGCNEYISGNGITLTFSDRYLSTLLRQLCGAGARKKRIPWWVLFEPKEKQIEIINGIWRGDGTKEIDGFSICSYSNTLLQQIQLMLNKLGIVSGIHKTRVKISGSSRNKMGKLLQVKHGYKGREIDFAHTDENYLYCKVRSKEKIPYEGKVYNLEVEKDNSFIANNYVTHNCQHEFGLFGLSPPFMNKFIETCKKISTPIIITYHSIPLVSSEFFLPYFKNSDNIFRKKIIHSETGVAAAKKIYGLTNGIHINHGTATYEGVTLDKFTSKEILGIPKDNKVLMSMGYFGGLKGVSELIDLFAEFRVKYPNSTFIYAGGLHPPTAKWGKRYMADCMKKIMSLGFGPKDFMITGYVPEDELLKYYSVADAYLLNYLSSGYISASGCSAKLIGTGRPIVTTGGTYRNEELTGGKNCVKVEAGNTGAMLSATIQLLEDKPKYDSIVSEGMKYANENSWENTAKEHVKLYEEVLV